MELIWCVNACAFGSQFGSPKKGAFVEAEGELRYREFQPSGSDTKIRSVDIHASSILTLDRAEKAEPEDELVPPAPSGTTTSRCKLYAARFTSGGPRFAERIVRARRFRDEEPPDHNYFEPPVSGREPSGFRWSTARSATAAMA